MGIRALAARGLRLATLALALVPVAAGAASLTIACGAVGIEYALCREGAEAWAAKTGNRVALVQTPALTDQRLGLFQQLLAAHADDIDVFQIDVIWPGMLGRHFLDLSRRVPAAEIARHFPRLIESYTVDGALVALPWFADVGVLYYREDLLARAGVAVPRTWPGLAAAARRVLAAKREGDLVGFVFQGRAYEGLTCNALEWFAGFGGGTIVDEAGAVTLANPSAAAALTEAAGWIGGIAPRGVLAYAEEEARGVFQSGRAVFMRNWPYAWALVQGPDSPVRGRVGIAPLPGGGVLGGGGLAVSRYSRNPDLAVDLVRYLTGPAEQRRRAAKGLFNPTMPALYEDPDLLAARPVLGRLEPLIEAAVVRPARQVGRRYNQVSSTFWNAVHEVLAGKAEAAAALARAARRIERLRRGGRW